MRLPTRTILTITFASMTLFAGGVAATVSANQMCKQAFYTCEQDRCLNYTDIPGESSPTGHKAAFVKAACLATCKAQELRCNIKALQHTGPRKKCMALFCK